MCPEAQRRIDPAAVAAQHETLCVLAAQTHPEEVRAVLALGAAVVLHGLLEPAHLAPVLALVDPAVEWRMLGDHERLADDLAYLDELLSSDPESPDLAIFSAALLERIRDHLTGDRGALYRPLARLLAASDVLS